MPTLNWSYHRPACKTCGKTQDYLQQAGVTAKTEVNARKERYQSEQALELLSRANRLLVARGAKQVDIDLKKNRPSDEELLKLVMGPTGNLRAPTLMVGKTMLVGFLEPMYDQVFGN